MSIKFRCPSCQQKMRVGEHHAGKQVACPACKKMVQIPLESTESDDAADDAAPHAPASKATIMLNRDGAPAAKASGRSVAVEAPKPIPPPPEPEATAKVVTPNGPEAEAPKAAEPAKAGFIKFNCPGCGKMTGFPAQLAGTTAACPVCKVQLMVPEKSGDESFIVGGAPASAAPAPAASGSSVPARAVAPAAPIHRPVPRAAASNSSIPRVERERIPVKPAAKGPSPLLIGIGAAALLAIVLGVVIGKKLTAPAPSTEVALATPSKSAGTEAPAARNVALEKPAEQQVRKIEKPPVVPETNVRRGAGSEPQSGAPVPDSKPKAAPPPEPEKSKPPEEAPRAPDTAPKAAPPATDAKPDDERKADAPKAPDTPPPGETPGDLKDFLNIKEPKARAQSPDKNSDDEDAPEVKDKAPKKKEAPKEGDLPGGLVTPKPETPPPPPKAVQKPAELPKLPVFCAQCYGTGNLPILPPRPYVFMEKEGQANAMGAVPWKYCPKCHPGKDPKALIQTEVDRIAAAPGLHAQWNGIKPGLVCGESRHVTLHGQLQPAQVKQTVSALEQLTCSLQEKTGNTLLVQARPDTHQILIFFDVVAYNGFIDQLQVQNPGQDYSLTRIATGTMSRKMSFFNANRGATPPENMALFQFAHMLMIEATDAKAPPWLNEGFASYCENLITKKNLCHSFAYEKNDVKFGQNWDADIKKFAMQSKLKTWDHIFPLEMIGLKALDYLTCYSMVRFLITSSPQSFSKFVICIREGMTSAEALEVAYGRKVKDLQMMWGQWTMNPR